MEWYELQYRTEVKGRGYVEGVSGWTRYADAHLPPGAKLEDFQTEADALREVYVHVRIVKKTTATEVVE